MATTKWKYAPGQQIIGPEGSPTTSNRTRQVEYEYIPDKVKGSFITFPNGSRFRKATNYLKHTGKISGSVGQNYRVMLGIKLDQPHIIRTSPGGYLDDTIFSSNCPPIGGISINKFADVPQFPSGMVNEAVTKALNNIADQKANIGENLATFRQTMNLIRSPASSLLSSLRQVWNDKSLRRLLNKSAKDLFREGPLTKAAEQYLKYVYGWKPLMHDIYGIMEMLKDKGDNPLLLSGEGKSKTNRGFPETDKWLVSDKAHFWWGPGREDVTVRCKVWARIDPDCQGLRTLNQLGLLNPASLAWELVKWSFVVDWFVPVGPVLNALTAPAGLTFVDATRSVKTNVKSAYSYRRDGWSNTPQAIVSDVKASGTAVTQKYRRDTYGNWPLPGLYFASDPFKGDRSLKALALGIVSLKSLR